MNRPSARALLVLGLSAGALFFAPERVDAG